MGKHKANYYLVTITSSDGTIIRRYMSRIKVTTHKQQRSVFSLAVTAFQNHFPQHVADSDRQGRVVDHQGTQGTDYDQLVG